MKMHTPIFGGGAAPKWKRGKPGKRNRLSASRFFLATFTSWASCGDNTPFQYNEAGFIQMCKQWDNSRAALIDRQRYRSIRNLMKREQRSSQHESIISDWRNRDVDRWRDLKSQVLRQIPTVDGEPIDGEKLGRVRHEVNFLEIIQAVLCGATKKRRN
jgi:hypothetical protein